jgi:hypothetical protein
VLSSGDEHLKRLSLRKSGSAGLVGAPSVDSVRKPVKLIHLLKWSAIACATLAITFAAEARSWGLRGFAQDSSGNLYTASYYPTSTKMRVSKRDQLNTLASTWCHDITPPTGFKFGGTQVIRIDGSGNIYIATGLISTATPTVNKYIIYKLTSAGSTSTSVIYNPIPSGQTGSIAGMVLDSSGNVYLAGTYGTSSTTFVNKYTSGLVLVATRAVPLTGYTTTVDDLVADGSGNIYVSAMGYNGSSQVASTVCKWDSSFGASPVWNPTYTLGANAVPASAGGCLVIDSSNNLTYLGTYSDSNNSFATNIYGVQYTSGGTKNWDNQPNLPGMVSGFWTILDASGDIVVAGTSLTTNYQIAKFNGSTGTVTWSTTKSITIGTTPIVCQDVSSGDYYVVSAQTSGAQNVSIVDTFTGSTGAFSSSNTYSSGPSGQDYGENILPSSTSGSYFVFGIGLSGATYYPLIYRRGGTQWAVYQTAVIP